MNLLLPLDDGRRVSEVILTSPNIVLHWTVPSREAAKVDVNGVWKINNSLNLTFMNITWIIKLMEIILGLNFLICINVNMEAFGKIVLYSSDIFSPSSVFTCISQWFILHSLLCLFVSD